MDALGGHDQALGLRARAVAGVRWTGLASGCEIAVQVGALAALARLLPPSEFGLMAIVAVWIGFLALIADGGLSNALIHHQGIAEEALSTLFWTSIGLATVLAALLAAASPWIAAAYGEPRLQVAFALASLHFPFSAAGRQLRILAEKDLRFGRVAAIQVCSAIAGASAAVALAWHHGTFLALVIGSLAATGTASVLAWAFLSRGWRPSCRVRIAAARKYFQFGALVVGTDVTNALASSADVLAGGRIMGATATGLYSVPKNLCLQIASAVNPVATRVGLPLMARAQHDRALLRRIYLATLRATASANFPLYLGVAAFAPEIVDLLLGAQWESAVPALRLLCAWALLRSTVNPVGGLLIACGKAARSLRWNLCTLALVLPVVWLGSRFGAEGLALAMTAFLACIGIVPVWFFLVRPLCEPTLEEYLRQLAVPFALAATAVAIAYVAAHPMTGALPRLAIGTFVGAITYIALSAFLNPAWVSALREVIGLRA